MGWIRKWRMRRMGLKDVPHYAPDVGLTAVDYIEPISPEKRLRRAELQIDKFLKETSPDRFSGSFFDAYTEQEGKLLISLLEEQKTWHEGVNSSIVLKHESELIRLRAEIQAGRGPHSKSRCGNRFAAGDLRQNEQIGLLVFGMGGMSGETERTVYPV